MTDRGSRRRQRRRRMWIERLLAVGVLLALALGGAIVLVGGDQGDSPANAAADPRSATSPAPASDAASADNIAPEPTATRGSRVRVAAAGDIALLGAPPDGGAGLFAGVADLLVGDVVLGNLEGTLTTGGTSKCAAGDGEARSNCFAFQAPPEVAAHFRTAGFTVLNVANNHSGDFGASGLMDTLAAVRGAGMEPTGHAGSVAFQTVRRANTVRPTRVAVLGFAPYAVANPLLDIEAAKEIVRRAAEDADVVVVTMHAGAEGSDRAHVTPGEETYLGERRGDVVAFSHGVIDSGADLVLGHGPHILRGMEVYQGRLIAYSLGNFATYRGLSTDGDVGMSAVVTATLSPDGRLVAGRIRPVQIASSGSPQPGGDAISRIRALSSEDFGPSAPRIDDVGRVLPPLTG